MSNANNSVVLPAAGITGLFVNGEWRTPANGKTMVVENPLLPLSAGHHRCKRQG